MFETNWIEISLLVLVGLGGVTWIAIRMRGWLDRKRALSGLNEQVGRLTQRVDEIEQSQIGMMIGSERDSQGPDD